MSLNIASLLLGVLGVMISLLGFGVTIYQVRMAKKAAENAESKASAVATSISKTAHDLAENGLSRHFQEIGKLSERLDVVVDEDNKSSARFLLLWINQECHSSVALIEEIRDANPDWKFDIDQVVAALNRTARAASIAKGDVVSKSKKLSSLTADTSTALSQLNEHLIRVPTAMQYGRLKTNVQ